ncbi:hypothetical protein PG985_012019 [Apiospora marii]|uniref:uncharacterized protein n=1 Tax=Apiospora marii TaxID=335849 RepID=UPI0031302D6F
MTYSSQAEGDRTATRVPSRITTLPTTAAERQAGRTKLSESRQESYASEPSSSGNRNVMLADQTRSESIAVKKAQKKTSKKLVSILSKYNHG